MGPLVLTDGGIETTLVFHGGFDLPCFAAFPLLGSDQGRAAIRRYFEPFLAFAGSEGLPFVLDTPTWRANPDWGAALGYGHDELAAVNRDAVCFARDLADERAQVTISGVLGPRADGYVAGELMTAGEAEAYHAWQVGVLGDAGVDRITALTLTYTDEAIGIVRAAEAADLQVVVSFTVETDGRLPGGEGLRASIERVDRETDGGAAFFMINCAHPTHFARLFDEGGAWLQRIGGLRVNASALSHAELDASEQLDEGDPDELAAHHRVLRDRLPGVRLLGGCCGTDHRHVRAIAKAWTARG